MRKEETKKEVRAGKLKAPILTLLFISLVLIPNALALNQYETHYYTSVGASNPAIIYAAPFRSTVNNCTSTLNVYANVSSGTSSSYSLTTDFYSPISTKIGTAYRELAGNYTCLFQGAINTGAAAYNEAKAIITRSGGTSSLGILDFETNCYTNSDWINLTVGYGLKDSNGKSYNSFFKHDCLAIGYQHNLFLNSSFMTACSGMSTAYINPANFTVLECFGGYRSVTWAVPFTTGDSGIITYQWAVPFSFVSESGSPSYGYYKPSDPLGTYVSLTSYGASGALTLESNTEYIFLLHGRIDATTGQVKNTADINISINVYSPSWSCGAWSDCEAGQQVRACTDPLGKVPAKMEYQGCFDEALATANLGFEDYETAPNGSLSTCQKWFVYGHFYGYGPLAGLGCWDVIVNITDYEYPTGWTIINNYDDYFADMTSEASSEGSRSLKMWSLPSGSVLPQTTDYTCNWTGTGRYPSVYKGISNSTMLAEYDIQFPSTYMTIDFDIKKCTEPIVQYDSGWWCGKSCFGYAGNCTDTPKGNYLFRIYNPTTGEIVVDYFDDATSDWSTRHIDISDKGIVPGQTYNLIFAVNPENPYDPYGHCVYFDNVNYAVRAAELSCDSNTCYGNDLYKPSLINGTCVFEVSYNDISCLPEDIREKVLNHEDYCIDQTLYSYNNASKEWIPSYNSTYCIEKEAENSIYEPNPFFSPVQNWLAAYGIDWIIAFTAPIFIALFIALIIPGIIMYKFNIRDEHGYIYIIMFFSILGTESIMGLFPIWFTIVLIILAGAILAYMRSK